MLNIYNSANSVTLYCRFILWHRQSLPVVSEVVTYCSFSASKTSGLKLLQGFNGTKYSQTPVYCLDIIFKACYKEIGWILYNHLDQLSAEL